MDKTEEAKQYGVLLDYDFTVLDGSSVTYKTAQKALAARGVTLSVKLEALHLAGCDYPTAFAKLFAALEKSADDAAVVTESFATELSAAMTAEAARIGASAGVKAFLNALTAKNVKVIVTTRGDVTELEKLLGVTDSPLVTVCAETGATYGNTTRDVLKHQMEVYGLSDITTVAVAGSGAGVKNALLAGVGAVAVVHDHVAYQDFGGADAVAESVDAALAAETLHALKLA